MGIQSRRPVIDRGRGTPALRLFGAAPVARGRTIPFEVWLPGTYAMRVWSEAEWAALDPADRPARAYLHNRTWVAIEVVPHDDAT